MRSCRARFLARVDVKSLRSQCHEQNAQVAASEKVGAGLSRTPATKRTPKERQQHGQAPQCPLSMHKTKAANLLSTFGDLTVHAKRSQCATFIGATETSSSKQLSNWPIQCRYSLISLGARFACKFAHVSLSCERAGIVNASKKGGFLSLRV